MLALPSTVSPARPVRHARPLVAALVTLAVFVGASLLLYQPTLKIGLLSDDFPILMWARRLELLPRDWGQMRPLPILAWWAIARLVPEATVPYALHVLSVVLHGLNAFLVWMLARRFLASTWAPLVAAALFVAMPVSVEPVAWPSGAFDVVLTTFALALALLLTAQPGLSPGRVLVGIVLAVLMIASKETGVIAGVLTLLLAWVKWGRLTRSAIALGVTQLLLAGGYALARELTDRLDHRLTPHLSVLSVTRLVWQSFGALIAPVHTTVVHAHPVLVATGVAAIVVALGSWPSRWRTQPGAARLAVLALAGVLVSVAPAITLFGIGPDLQGTRYVYLASAWWAIALTAALVDGWTERVQRMGTAVVAVLLIAGAVTATRLHQQPWIRARAMRDQVLRELTALPASCRRAAAPQVPDNVDGAYVFRNGLDQALATLGRSFEWVELADAAPECQVTSFVR